MRAEVERGRWPEVVLKDDRPRLRGSDAVRGCGDRDSCRRCCLAEGTLVSEVQACTCPASPAATGQPSPL